MTKRLCYVGLLLALAALLAGAAWYPMGGGTGAIEGYVSVERTPHIRPDYAATVIPPNIAPLNFCVAEPGVEYHVQIHSVRGEPIVVRSETPRIAIPMKPWRRLLSQNAGQELRFDILARGQDGSWRRFQTITNKIAVEEIDAYVTYRLINVLYNYYTKMSMRQRNVEGFERSLILAGRSFGDGCMNCHTFLNHKTDKMIFHVRSGHIPYGGGMFLIEDGQITKVDTRTQFNPGYAAFSSWHPSGRAIAFSINKVRQFFHAARPEVREGIDLKSDLALYLLDSNAVTSTRAISAPDRLETWPAWSADGRHLYFCSAPLLWPTDAALPPPRYDEVRYDLMRIGYDIEAGTWGEAETVLSAEETGLSISLPRASPDGRFLMFCMSKYGGFPALYPDSDMYLMDLKTGEHRPLACNSDESDSWHAWSSNSRWIVFSSKRGDGLFMKAYFSYVDENGNASKAFVLPQKEPDFYDSFIRVYQLPEFSTQAIPLAGEEIAHAIRSGPWVPVGPPVTGATP